jgi:hypothetical protein
MNIADKIQITCHASIAVEVQAPQRSIAVKANLPIAESVGYSIHRPVLCSEYIKGRRYMTDQSKYL